MGIPGLLLFLWLIASLFAMAGRILRRTPSPATYLRSLTFSASLVALLLYALFAFPLRNPVPFLYFSAFLAYLSAEDKLLPEGHSCRKGRVSYLMVWPAALFLLALSYPLTLQWFWGDLHLRKARTFLSQNQGDLALRHYREAIYHYFPYHHQHKLRSISLDEHRLQSQLIDQYRIALLSEPSDARLHLELGNALLESGRLEEALSATKKAIALDQAWAEAHERLGLIYLRMNDLPKATAEFGGLIRRDPSSARAHFFLGIALYRQGHLPEARRAWESALRLDPSLTGVQNLLSMTAQGRN
jgi:tetratricopeptide (TPR) repeat protein